MSLIRFQRTEPWLLPFDRLSSLREEINRLFESPLDSAFRQAEYFNGWVPVLDVYEDKDNLIVRVELPGMKKEDIELSLHGDTLTISGERKSERTDKEGDASRVERFVGRFQRSVTLPRPVDSAKVSARYQDGILTVTLAKTEEAKPKQIKVKAA